MLVSPSYLFFSVHFQWIPSAGGYNPETTQHISPGLVSSSHRTTTEASHLPESGKRRKMGLLPVPPFWTGFRFERLSISTKKTSIESIRKLFSIFDPQSHQSSLTNQKQHCCMLASLASLSSSSMRQQGAPPPVAEVKVKQFIHKVCRASDITKSLGNFVGWRIQNIMHTDLQGLASVLAAGENVSSFFLLTRGVPTKTSCQSKVSLWSCLCW